MQDDDEQPPKPDEKPNGFLIHGCPEGDGVLIGPDIKVVVKSIKGSKAYLAIQAPRERKISRIKK